MVKKDSSKVRSAGRIAKRGLRATVLAALIATPIAFGASYGAKWLFQVPENYGVVVTRVDGDREAITDHGWYWRAPIASTYEEKFALANQMIFLDGNPDPHDVIAGDKKVIRAAGTTMYSITDLDQYAIQNVLEQPGSFSNKDERHMNTPKQMIQRKLDEIVGGYIQNTDSSKLIHDRISAQEEIYELLKASEVEELFGITINTFGLNKTTYIGKVTEAEATRQVLVAEAEGRKEAALIDKDAIETLTGARVSQLHQLMDEYKPETPEERKNVLDVFKELEQFRVMETRSGDTVWMLEGDSPSPVYNPQPKRER